MHKYVCFVFLFLAFLSCNENKGPVANETSEPASFSFQDYPKLIELEESVLPTVSSWPEYMALENSIAVLKRATNTEDLKLAIDDLIDKEKALAESTYPAEFDKLPIKSRQQVFRTFLYKVKGNLQDNRAIQEGMEQLINAYNAYKKQYNFLSSTTLDPKLILDEE